MPGLNWRREKKLLQRLHEMEQRHAEVLQQTEEEIRQHITRYTLLNDELIAAQSEHERKLAKLEAAHRHAIKGVTEDLGSARAKTSTLQSELQKVRYQLQLERGESADCSATTGCSL